jgi:hypothetical protein
MEILCGLDDYREIQASARGIDLDIYELGLHHSVRICFKNRHRYGRLSKARNEREVEDRKALEGVE